MWMQLGIVLLCALYGLVFTLGKLSLNVASPLVITGLRMLIAGLILAGFSFLKSGPKAKMSYQELKYIIVLSFIGIYLTNYIEFWGLQYLSSGKTCLLVSFAPIASAIISYLMYREKFSKRQILGLVIGIVGFLPMLEVSKPSLVSKLEVWAEVAVLVSAVTTAMAWVAMQRAIQAGFSALRINAYSMILGGAIALIHASCSEVWPIEQLLKPEFVLHFGLLLLVSNIICANLSAYLLKFYSATYLLLASLSTPFFTALFSWLWFGEQVSLAFWFAMVLVCSGVILYHLDEIKTHKKTQ